MLLIDDIDVIGAKRKNREGNTECDSFCASQCSFVVPRTHDVVVAVSSRRLCDRLLALLDHITLERYNVAIVGAFDAVRKLFEN